MGKLIKKYPILRHVRKMDNSFYEKVKKSNEAKEVGIV